MCILIVVHQFNRMHPWSTWEGMLPGGCSPGKRCYTFLEQEYRVVTRGFGQSALCS